MMPLQPHKENDHGQRTATEKQGSEEAQEGSTQVTGLFRKNQGRELRMESMNSYLDILDSRSQQLVTTLKIEVKKVYLYLLRAVNSLKLMVIEIYPC